MIEVNDRRFLDAEARSGSLLKRVGALAVSISQRAFEDQRFDGRPWPEAYEGREPRVRIANLVGTLTEGGKPPDRVLEGRPAGVYSNELYKSIEHRVVEETEQGGIVEVGSWQPYADRFQRGGRSTQSITPEVRDGLLKWLDSLDGGPDRKMRRRYRTLVRQIRRVDDQKSELTEKRKALTGERSPKATKQRAALKKKRATLDGRKRKLAEERDQIREQLKNVRSNPYRDVVGFLFGVDELVTNSVPRPFVAVTSELERRVAATIEDFFGQGGR